MPFKDYKEYTAQIPEGARVYKNGRVVVVTNPSANTRRVIGYVCDEGLMHPTGLYFRMFSKEWVEQHPDMSAMCHQPSLGIGLYALTLGIGMQTGLYPALVKVYGAKIANGLMDFTMYNLMTGSSCNNTFSAIMSDKALFSILPYEDSWLSNLFEKNMDERRNNCVRSGWIKACISNGLTNVYVSIDGTNMDEVGKNNELSQRGHDKSGTGKTIVSSIWVVCANGDHSGLPLTYFVTEGNVVDSKAVKKVFGFISKFHLNLKGVLADRGFCADDVFTYLHNANIDYVIMMKENTVGYKDMMDQYSVTIRENPAYVLRNGHKYGILAKDERLLKNLKFLSNVALIYDTMNGASRRDNFMSEVCAAMNDWNDASIQGKDCKIPSKYQDYVTVDTKERRTHLNVEKVKAELDTKGYYALGTSLSLSPTDIDEIYNLRDASEKGFSALKTAQGFNTLRSHGKTGIQNKFFAAFLGSIIRSEIMNACKRHKCIPNKFIITASKFACDFECNQYEYDTKLPDKMKGVLAEFGLNDDSIRSILPDLKIRYDAEEGIKYKQQQRSIQQKKKDKYLTVTADSLNDELSADLNDFSEEGSISKTMEDHVDQQSKAVISSSQNQDSLNQKEIVEQEKKAHKKRGRKPKINVEKPKGPGRGRVKGSKNKKTLEKERLIAEGLLELPPKKPIGRPKKPETIKKEEDWQRIRIIATGRGVDLPEKRPKGRPAKIVMEIVNELAKTG